MKERRNKKKDRDKKKIPRWAKLVLIATFIFYIWYFASTLLVPLAEFLGLPQESYLTIYKMIGFPPAILGFMICISLISTIIISLEFEDQKTATKIFLTEGVTFILYFIIPIITTIFMLILLTVKESSQIATENGISYILGDLFLFTAALFLMTAVLNIATQRIIAMNTENT